MLPGELGYIFPGLFLFYYYIRGFVVTLLYIRVKQDMVRRQCSAVMSAATQSTNPQALQGQNRDGEVLTEEQARSRQEKLEELSSNMGLCGQVGAMLANLVLFFLTNVIDVIG